jgi:hypothetical protein
MEFGLLLDFLNPGCGFEEFRKTVSGVAPGGPSFPLLPQAGKKSLCKAEDLCE